MIASIDTIQDKGMAWGGGELKNLCPPSTSFSPVTSANLGISPQNFLTYSFKPFVTLV